MAGAGAFIVHSRLEGLLPEVAFSRRLSSTVLPAVADAESKPTVTGWLKAVREIRDSNPMYFNIHCEALAFRLSSYGTTRHPPRGQLSRTNNWLISLRPTKKQNAFIGGKYPC